jgi:hypothetical protein
VALTTSAIVPRASGAERAIPAAACDAACIAAVTRPSQPRERQAVAPADSARLAPSTADASDCSGGHEDCECF